MTENILAQEEDLYDEFEDDGEDDYLDDYADVNDYNVNGNGVREDAGN